MHHPRVIVAIDGPAGVGKSTIARRVASRLGALYIDTGAMYRAVALWALRQDIDLTDMHRMEALAAAADIRLEQGALRVFLNGEDVSEAIRAKEVSSGASKVAVIPGVRRAMVERQRAMAEQFSVVMEGRDIGTVVFPDATVKVFLDADPRIRAERRLAELRSKGESTDDEEVRRELQERDTRDSSRAEAPLLQAPDAHYLDTTHLAIEEVEEAVLRLIRNRTSNGKDHSS